MKVNEIVIWLDLILRLDSCCLFGVVAKNHSINNYVELIFPKLSFVSTCYILICSCTYTLADKIYFCCLTLKSKMKYNEQISWLCFLLLTPCALGARNTTGLDGRNLIIAAEHWPPYFMISGDTEHRLFSGFMTLVLAYLQTSLNFTSTIVRPPDGNWGAFDAGSGRWGGMVGMVNRNEVDFALGKLL